MNCLIGHFGDHEDDLNEALLQASNEFKSKVICLMQQLHPWLWLAVASSHAPSTTSAAHCQPNPLSFTLQLPPYNYTIFVVWLYRNYTVALQKFEPHLQIAVFE